MRTPSVADTSIAFYGTQNRAPSYTVSGLLSHQSHMRYFNPIDHDNLFSSNRKPPLPIPSSLSSQAQCFNLSVTPSICKIPLCVTQPEPISTAFSYMPLLYSGSSFILRKLSISGYVRMKEASKTCQVKFRGL